MKTKDFIPIKENLDFSESNRINVQKTKNNLFNKENENIKIKKKKSIPDIKLKENEILVTNFDERCEDYSRIEKIIPLQKNNIKFSIFIFLNIITVGILYLVTIWFPKLNLYLIYSKTTIENADFIGIYGTDQKFYIEKIKNINLPNIEDSIIKRNFLFNFNNNFLKIFTFKLFTYIYDENEKIFNGFYYDIKESQEKIISELSQGLTSNEIEHQKMLFGLCDLIISIPSIPKLILDEFSDPFYIFQIYSIILWYFTEYVAYATVIVVASLISLITAVYETRSSLICIKNMARYSVRVNVYRKNSKNEKEIINIDSTDLIPGDLFEVPDDGCALPCDCILINGTVIVNESMLTGESTPIIKNNMRNVDVLFDSSVDDKHVLFAGTKIVQKRARNNEKILAICYKTSFDTVKGNLIRSILFPKEIEQNFKKESVKYIIIMAILSVGGFLVSLPFLKKNAGYTNTEILIKALDLVTTTVPPALPTCLGVGISYALSRLKDSKILCINRERVNIVGKINFIVFDKTGTLTEDHLDIKGYRPMILRQEKKNNNSNKFVFDEFQEHIDNYVEKSFKHYKEKHSKKIFNKNEDLKQLFVECLSTCHGITKVKGKMIGDPIDVKMFQATGWELQENIEGKNNIDSLVLAYVRPKHEEELNKKLAKDVNGEKEDEILSNHYELAIVRRFDFSSKLQRMTTLVKDNHDSFFKVFCKGSPEKIKELCKSETIPENFNSVLASYTTQGLRVLACCCKFLKMDLTQAQKVTQENVEKNMIFLGLLIVQNKLKKATIKSLDVLDKANLKMVMATGDNILTAISVSKECHLIKKNSVIYSVEIEKKNNNNSNNNNNNENNNDENNIFNINNNNNNNNSDNNTNNNNIDSNNNNNNDNNFKLIWNQIDEFEENKSSGSNEENTELLNHHLITNDSANFEEKFIESLVDNQLKTLNKTTNNNTNINNTNINNNNNSFIFEGDQKKFTESDKNFNEISLISNNIEIQNNFPFQFNEDKNIIAITGPTFEELFKKKKKYLQTKQEKYKLAYETFRFILRHGAIFARMSPEHKTLLVENLRQENFNVMMCGDGANDCGALRTADVGVSLSPEEASIAAHFTSQIPDISCLITLLREGKASLVTSIQTFKYMMMYSFIQFFNVTLLMCYYSYLSDNQYLVSDVFIIFPLAFFIAQTSSYENLTKDVPESSLLSVSILSSILIHMSLTFIFQFSTRLILKSRNWYVSTCEEDGSTVFACSDNTALFLVGNMQYLISAISFSMDYPYRKPFYSNCGLVMYLAIALFISIYFIVAPAGWVKKLVTLDDFEDPKFKYVILAICVVNFVVDWCVEKFIIRLIEIWDNKRKIKNIKRKISQNEGEEYKISDYVAVEMYNRGLREDKNKERMFF